MNSSAELENLVETRLQMKVMSNSPDRSKLELLQEVLQEEAKKTMNLQLFELREKPGVTVRVYQPPPEDVANFKTFHYILIVKCPKADKKVKSHPS